MENNKIQFHSIKHDYLKNLFFASTTIKWKRLDQKIQNFLSIGISKNIILTFIRSVASNTFTYHHSRKDSMSQTV